MTVGGHTVAPGRRVTFDLPVARLPTDTWLSMPVAVLNGRRGGPRVWLSAAVHGDEVVGVEVIRQVLRRVEPRDLAGTVVAVPIVNVFGFVSGERYLPDRRDLNRSFPGSGRGSLAARLAHLLMEEVVAGSGYGIDLHTGSDHRENLPQVRADLDDPETRRLALAFGTPVVLHARTRDGSLREAATRRGTRVLVFEGGEAHRYSVEAVSAAVGGVLRVLAALGMCGEPSEVRSAAPRELRRSQWVRARRSGLLRCDVALGEQVDAGGVLGVISDAFGDVNVRVTAPGGGVVVARTNNPLVSQGDALFHLAHPELASMG